MSGTTPLSKTPRIRRCAAAFVELREDASLDLQDVLSGGTGMKLTQRLMLQAPHLADAIELSLDELQVLSRISSHEWVAREDLTAAPALIDRLVENGALVQESGGLGTQADGDIRASRWFSPAALLHARSRWSGIDSVAAMETDGLDRAPTMRHRLGAPPPARSLGSADIAVALSLAPASAFDELLLRRATCRNFETGRPLPLQAVSQLLHRVFGEHGSIAIAADTRFVKKNVPSGGSLHPTDAIVMIQQVEGVLPGAYAYDPARHALMPIELLSSEPLDAYLLNAVAGQYWFADAHVLLILAPRFERTFWKYRNHAKAYRVVAMEAGHIAQTVYLAATEAGLGAFVTAAINEVDIDRSLGFDGITQGSIAICGFGWRASTMKVAEFDPKGVVWPTALGAPGDG